MGRSGERRRTMERWVCPVANKITTGKDSSSFLTVTTKDCMYIAGLF